MTRARPKFPRLPKQKCRHKYTKKTVSIRCRALLNGFMDYSREMALGSQGIRESSTNDHLLMPLKRDKTWVSPTLPVQKDREKNVTRSLCVQRQDRDLVST